MKEITVKELRVLEPSSEEGALVRTSHQRYQGDRVLEPSSEEGALVR